MTSVLLMGFWLVRELGNDHGERSKIRREGARGGPDAMSCDPCPPLPPGEGISIPTGAASQDMVILSAPQSQERLMSGTNPTPRRS